MTKESGFNLQQGQRLFASLWYRRWLWSPPSYQSCAYWRYRIQGRDLLTLNKMLQLQMCGAMTEVCHTFFWHGTRLSKGVTFYCCYCNITVSVFFNYLWS